MLKRFLVKIISLYQKLASPFLGKHCRFLPTCSEYAQLSIEKHGAVKGTALSLWRLIRCSPLSKGGIDMP